LECVTNQNLGLNIKIITYLCLIAKIVNRKQMNILSRCIEVHVHSWPWLNDHQPALTYYTECNTIRYANLKICCGLCVITTQFVTERLSTLQILRHLKPRFCGYHWLVRCSRPSNRAYFTDVRKAKCVLQFEQNQSATLVQRWYRTNYGKEAPTIKFIYK
jgi:hypothetical protein